MSPPPASVGPGGRPAPPRPPCQVTACGPTRDTPGPKPPKDPGRCQVSATRGDDLRAVGMAGRPRPGLRGAPAGTCHPSWTVPNPSPASGLPEGRRVLGERAGVQERPGSGNLRGPVASEVCKPPSSRAGGGREACWVGGQRGAGGPGGTRCGRQALPRAPRGMGRDVGPVPAHRPGRAASGPGSDSSVRRGGRGARTVACDPARARSQAGAGGPGLRPEAPGPFRRGGGFAGDSTSSPVTLGQSGPPPGDRAGPSTFFWGEHWPLKQFHFCSC